MHSKKKITDKMKDNLTELEKIFANYMVSQGLIFKIYELLVQLNIKWTGNSFWKMGRRPKYTFFQRRHSAGQQTQKLLIIREMQIETMTRYFLTPIRMAIIKMNIYKKCWWGYGEKETLVYWWWKCKLMQPLWKKYGGSSQK